MQTGLYKAGDVSACEFRSVSTFRTQRKSERREGSKPSFVCSLGVCCISPASIALTMPWLSRLDGTSLGKSSVGSLHDLRHAACTSDSATRCVFLSRRRHDPRLLHPTSHHCAVRTLRRGHGASKRVVCAMLNSSTTSQRSPTPPCALLRPPRVLPPSIHFSVVPIKSWQRTSCQARRGCWRTGVTALGSLHTTSSFTPLSTLRRYVLARGEINW